MSIEIGAKIRQLRQQKGITQEMLGSALNITAQAISKWESGATMPDIQLLPQLAVTFGVTIDELFSMTDDSRLERIDNMIYGVRFIPKQEFEDTERYLKERMEQEKTKASATLLLARLYTKRAKEYNDLAAPLARKALLLNPDEKCAHNAIFDAEQGPQSDWNNTNYWQLIEFYKDFLKKHPQNPRTYLWLMDLLIHDGRTAEARGVLAAMDTVEHSYRTDLYFGLIAKAECDLPAALEHWQRMTEEFPDNWLSWASRADCMASLCRYDEAIEFYQKAIELQPSPKFVDSAEAIAQISEIRGDLNTAIAMREKCIAICRTDWDLTVGEWVDCHKREIDRLREKMKA